MSFDNVDKSPVYIGCEKFVSNENIKKCFNSKIEKHIKDNFDFDLINCLKHRTVHNKQKGSKKKCIPFLIPGEKRIYLDFIINEDGYLDNVGARAPHNKLIKEALRVANLIPKIVAAIHNNRPVRVTYTVPIDLIAK